MIRSVPNLLSLARILLAVWLFFTILGGQTILACGILLVSGLTDFLDGFIARRFGCTSGIGGLLDPLADKIFFTTLFSALLITKIIPLWFFLVLIGRDVVLLLGTMIIKIQAVTYEFTPTFLSKINTTLQFLFGVIALLMPHHEIRFVLIGMIMVTTILSGLLYVKRYLAHA